MTAAQFSRAWPGLKVEIERALDARRIVSPDVRRFVVDRGARFCAAIVETTAPLEELPTLDSAADDAAMRAAVASALERYRRWQHDVLSALFREHLDNSLKLAQLFDEIEPHLARLRRETQRP